jgi:hypothetical protein
VRRVRQLPVVSRGKTFRLFFSALSRPLPEDDVLFKEVDSVLAEIRRCYKELDKFWMEEISRATEAYEKRRVDETDIKHWKIFCANLKQTLDSWKVRHGFLLVCHALPTDQKFFV